MVAVAACGCGGQQPLPKRLRRDLLEELTGRTKLTAKEVQALYARFRRLAPRGYLMPEQFKQTMGVIGLTDDPFLPDRMFHVFDKDSDGKLSFLEFASSLAVMIRGSEDEKLKLSFQMAAGPHRGIRIDDFKHLIRACNTMMSSLVAQSSKALSSEEDIERLFHDLSSCEEGGGAYDDTDEELAVITLEAYKAAAQSNEEFLFCLGLDPAGSKRQTQQHSDGHGHHQRRGGHRALSGSECPHSPTHDGMQSLAHAWSATPSLASQAPLAVPQQPSSASSGRQGGNMVAMPAADLESLQERLASLRQAVLHSHAKALNLQGNHVTNGSGRTGSAQGGIQAASASAAAGEVGAAQLSSNEDPDERWWTPPLRPAAPGSRQRPSSAGKLPGTGLEEVEAEFSKVFRWCSEHRRSPSKGSGGHAAASSLPPEAPSSPSGFGIGKEHGPLSMPSTRAPPAAAQRRPTAVASSSSAGACKSPGLLAKQLGYDFVTGKSSGSSALLSQAACTSTSRDDAAGFERSNVHHLPPPHGGEKETFKHLSGSSLISGVCTKNNPSSRRRKRHRLLGPKKGLAVHFGHENWNMVLSMMIGIRMSVGRSKHEIARELQPVDFIMKEKFSIIPRLANVFDSAVSKRVAITRFVDYAPLVFQKIRASFGIQHDEYLRSIGPEQLLGNLVLGNLASLSELSSEGKSGAFFYYTADGNYMIKTVVPKEMKLLKHMLKNYYDHITQQPNTLIVRFLGLHCLRVRKVGRRGGHSTRKLYFVVMGNMFNTPFEIHRRYDLKGSWIGRSTPESEARDPTVALKDVDFTKACEHIRIGADRKAKLMAQIQRDCTFLTDNNIIDYSLLLGIHEIGDGSGGGGLHAFPPGDAQQPRRPDVERQISDHDTLDFLFAKDTAAEAAAGAGSGGGGRVQLGLDLPPSPQASGAIGGHCLGQSEGDYYKDLAVGPGTPGSVHQVSTACSSTAHGCVVAQWPGDLRVEVPMHHRDMGGMLSSDKKSLYFLGIIDILTPYDTFKRLEHTMKSFRNDWRGVSCCPPSYYGQRFKNFMQEACE
eukprot:TRINITY_DN7370_c1_g1_i1.p1 TRINITY_DN7370_c1_g1~~TRINITY_DN7370_c1_g1_i1.p1  ORF type:complete len:1049 (+),score=270.21 TRINITY_DN7370_c1_g1_i1:126-3272(+)